MSEKKLNKKNRTGLTKILFEVQTNLHFSVRTTKGYWKIITTVKHPSMAGQENEVKRCLLEPDEVRLSKKDNRIYLFYKKIGRKKICVIVKKKNGNGFIVTSYFTDKIKEGEMIWKK